MTISREEIAVHCLASLLTRDGYDGAGAARDAVVAADALLLALTPAPGAPPAGKYVPKVGDVVVVSDRKISGHPTGAILRLDRLLSDDDPLRWRATTLMEPAGGPFWRGTVCLINTDEVRPATPSECAAAGLAVPPPATAGAVAPAPDRTATHVKVTKKRDCASSFWTIGKVYPVVSWDCGDPRCVSDDGTEKYIRTYEWEPAPTPAPEVLTPDVPEGSTIAQLAAEQRASMGLTASVGGTQYFKHDTTPAPEAKRPTLADVERSAEAFAHHKGDIPHSPSDAWMDGWLARDRAVAHDGIAHSTNAPCPPPVASNPKRDEAVRALVNAALDLEHFSRWLNQTNPPAVKYVRPHAKEVAANATRALRLARDAGLCEGGSK